MAAQRLVALTSVYLLALPVRDAVVPTRMQLTPWDLQSQWHPILASAATHVLNNAHAGSAVLRIHEADCRVASTVKYDVEVGFGQKRASGNGFEARASTSFYDEDITWRSLHSGNQHPPSSATWGRQGANSAFAFASTRAPLPRVGDSAVAGKPMDTLPLSPEHNPLHPDDVLSTMDVALPGSLRLFMRDSDLSLSEYGPRAEGGSDGGRGNNNGRGTDSLPPAQVAGDVVDHSPVVGVTSTVLLPEDVPADLHMRGVESIELREAVSLDARGLPRSGHMVDVTITGASASLESKSALSLVPTHEAGGAPHSSALVGSGGAEAGQHHQGWWERVSGWGTTQTKLVQQMITTVGEQTGLAPSAVTQATARPIVLLSLSFDATHTTPALHELPVRAIKERMRSAGIIGAEGDLAKTVGPEKADLIARAVESGLAGGAVTETRRVEAVVEGDMGAWRLGHEEEVFGAVVSAFTIDPQQTAARQTPPPPQQQHTPGRLWPRPLESAAAAVPGRSVGGGGGGRALSRWAQPRHRPRIRSEAAMMTAHGLGDAPDWSLDTSGGDEKQLWWAGRRICHSCLVALASAAMQLAEAVGVAAGDGSVRDAASASACAGAVLVALAAGAAAAATAVGRSHGRRRAAAAATAVPSGEGRARHVTFKPTVRVRRFQESPQELNDRWRYWQALSARTQAHRRAAALRQQASDSAHVAVQSGGGHVLV